MSRPSVPPIVIDGRIIFRPQCRGIARSVIGLVERFPTEAADGSVKVLVTRGGSTPFDLAGVARRAELVETDLPVVALHRVAALRRLLQRLGAGVLFEPYHPFTPLAAPCPVVSAVHDCIWEENPAYAGGRARQLAFVGLTRVSLARADAVTVPSCSTAAAVRTIYPGVEVTGVVPNGVGTPTAGEPPFASAEVTRAELGLPDRYVLHVGARRPHKNQVLLVEALARLDPSVSLVLVGDRDPRMADPVEARVEALGLGDRVHSLTGVAERHLPGVYAGASVFGFPSFVEGYGIPPLEAMVAGTPVVAAAIPVLAEVCADAAVYVSPHDVDAWVGALGRLLDDPAAARPLVQRGREVARAASWDRGGAALYRLLAAVARP